MCESLHSLRRDHTYINRQLSSGKSCSAMKTRYPWRRRDRSDIRHYPDRYNDDNYSMSRSSPFPYNLMRTSTTTGTMWNQYAAWIKDDRIKAAPTSSFVDRIRFPRELLRGKNFKSKFSCREVQCYTMNSVFEFNIEIFICRKIKPKIY